MWEHSAPFVYYVFFDEDEPRESGDTTPSRRAKAVPEQIDRRPAVTGHANGLKSSGPRTACAWWSGSAQRARASGRPPTRRDNRSPLSVQGRRVLVGRTIAAPGTRFGGGGARHARGLLGGAPAGNGKAPDACRTAMRLSHFHGESPPPSLLESNRRAGPCRTRTLDCRLS